MNRLIYFLATILFFCSCAKPDIIRIDTKNNKHGNFNAEQEMYISTYKYIIANGSHAEEDYIVSKNSYNLDRWVFSHKLVTMPEIKLLVDSFTEKNKYDTTLRVKKGALTFLSKRVKSPKFVIFYSDIVDGMIVANVFQFDSRIHTIDDTNHYETISRFNSSQDYLFIFENNKLKKTIKVEVNTD